MPRFAIRVPQWPGSSVLCWKNVEAENCDDAERIGKVMYGRVVEIASVGKCGANGDMKGGI